MEDLRRVAEMVIDSIKEEIEKEDTYKQPDYNPIIYTLQGVARMLFLDDVKDLSEEVFKMLDELYTKRRTKQTN